MGLSSAEERRLACVAQMTEEVLAARSRNPRVAVHFGRQPPPGTIAPAPPGARTPWMMYVVPEYSGDQAKLSKLAWDAAMDAASEVLTSDLGVEPDSIARVGEGLAFPAESTRSADFVARLLMTAAQGKGLVPAIRSVEDERLLKAIAGVLGYEVLAKDRLGTRPRSSGDDLRPGGGGVARD